MFFTSVVHCWVVKCNKSFVTSWDVSLCKLMSRLRQCLSRVVLISLPEWLSKCGGRRNLRLRNHYNLLWDYIFLSAWDLTEDDFRDFNAKISSGQIWLNVPILILTKRILIIRWIALIDPIHNVLYFAFFNYDVE